MQLVGEVGDAVPHAAPLFDKEVVAGVGAALPRDLAGQCVELRHQPVERHAGVQLGRQLVLQQHGSHTPGNHVEADSAVFTGHAQLFHCTAVHLLPVQLHPDTEHVFQRVQRDGGISHDRKLGVGGVDLLFQRKGGDAVLIYVDDIGGVQLQGKITHSAVTSEAAAAVSGT